MSPVPNKNSSPQEQAMIEQTVRDGSLVLGRVLDRLVNCLALAKAILDGGTRLNLERATEEIYTEAGAARKDLEALGQRLTQMKSPVPPMPGQPRNTMLQAVFGDENRFRNLVEVRYEELGITDEWLNNLKDLILTGRRSLVGLSARLAVARKSGLLPGQGPSAGRAAPATNTTPAFGSTPLPAGASPLPSANKLAGNPIGPPKISRLIERVPSGADHPAVEGQRPAVGDTPKSGQLKKAKFKPYWQVDEDYKVPPPPPATEQPKKKAKSAETTVSTLTPPDGTPPLAKPQVQVTPPPAPFKRTSSKPGSSGLRNPFRKNFE
ncbi:MAG: hypothetical protein L6R28_25065 [Planctomycetes bacterium]|nr:hypothetical protein [Planctomycetota bacterium]